MGSDTKRELPILHVPDEIAYEATPYQALDPRFELYYDAHSEIAWRHLENEPAIASSLEQFGIAFPDVDKEVELAEMSYTSHMRGSDVGGVTVAVFCSFHDRPTEERFVNYIMRTPFGERLVNRSGAIFGRDPYGVKSMERYRFQFPIQNPRVVKVLASAYGPSSLHDGTYSSHLHRNEPPKDSFREFVDVYIAAIRQARQEWIYENYMRNSYSSR